MERLHSNRARESLPGCPLSPLRRQPDDSQGDLGRSGVPLGAPELVCPEAPPGDQRALDRPIVVRDATVDAFRVEDVPLPEKIENPVFLDGQLFWGLEWPIAEAALRDGRLALTPLSRGGRCRPAGPGQARPAASASRRPAGSRRPSAAISRTSGPTGWTSPRSISTGSATTTPARGNPRSWPTSPPCAGSRTSTACSSTSTIPTPASWSRRERTIPSSRPTSCARFPAGLGPIAAASEALGMRLGLWLGPDGFGETPGGDGRPPGPAPLLGQGLQRRPVQDGHRRLGPRPQGQVHPREEIPEPGRRPGRGPAHRPEVRGHQPPDQQLALHADDHRLPPLARRRRPTSTSTSATGRRASTTATAPSGGSSPRSSSRRPSASSRTTASASTAASRSGRTTSWPRPSAAPPSSRPRCTGRSSSSATRTIPRLARLIQLHKQLEPLLKTAVPAAGRRHRPRRRRVVAGPRAQHDLGAGGQDDPPRRVDRPRGGARARP